MRIRSAITTLAALFFIAITSQAWSKTITIEDDPGGSIFAYHMQTLRMEGFGTVIRFNGHCNSACTIYLSRAKCVTPVARFGFHLPIDVEGEDRRLATEFLLDNYPAWVRDWIDTAGGLEDEPKYMPASYAARHIGWCTPA